LKLEDRPLLPDEGGWVAARAMVEVLRLLRLPQNQRALQVPKACLMEDIDAIPEGEAATRARVVDICAGLNQYF
jgi:hypothetical protein